MWTKYVQEIINELNELQPLPKRGLLAGGAIANKIWEKVTGISMPVNDIDIFNYSGLLEVETIDKDRFSKYTWIEKEKAKKIDTYSGIKYESRHNKCYRIEEHAREGLLNTVSYVANTSDPNLIIESFDINCTQVGYDLETGTLYYSKYFDEFIRTGELKVVCANTPCHTYIRLLKKRDELKAKLNKKVEFKYLSIARVQTFENYIRHYFGSKYMDMIKLEWIEELSEEKIILKAVDTEGWKTQGKLWTFEIQNDTVKKPTVLGDILYSVSSINHVKHLRSLDDLNFYIRSVFGDKRREDIWDNFGQMWSRNKEYITTIPSDEDVKWLLNYYIKVPQIEITLDGLTFDEQIYIVKKLESLTDIETTSCLLRICKIEDIDICDDDVLLMSLKARKLIYNNIQFNRNNEYFSL